MLTSWYEALICMWVCVRVCVGVCVRERERERVVCDDSLTGFWKVKVRVCVPVCVCVGTTASP